MSDVNLTYHREKALILSGDRRKGYGEFKSLCEAMMREARRCGRKFIEASQACWAEMLGVCERTVKRWCDRAYDEGVLKPDRRRYQRADGTWYSYTNRYEVSLTVRIRKAIARRWAALMQSASDSAEAVSDAGGVGVDHRSDICVTQEFLTENSSSSVCEMQSEREFQGPFVKAIWSCGRCSGGNMFSAPRCFSCKSEKPATARKLFLCR